MKVSPLAILLIGLLAVVLFFPNILSQFGIPGIEDLPLSDNTVGVGITLNFADGTSETYEPKELNTLIPLTVTYDDKLVDSIEFIGQAKITYTGELETVWVSGTFECITSNVDDDKIKTESISLTRTTPQPSDEWFIIAYLSVSSIEIEDGCSRIAMNGISGLMEITEFKTKTTDGLTQTFKGSAKSGVVVFIEQGAVSAVSLEVNAEHLFS